MKQYIVKDTCEVFIDSDNGNTYFYGLTTESSIVRNMTQELIKAGIGSKVVGIISESDGYDISVTTGLFYEDTIEIQIGEEFTSVEDLKVQDIVESELGVITATPKTVTGNAIELEASAVPKNAKLQLRTVAYDPQENQIVADIYWIFDKVAPSGEFTHAFGMGTNNVQELGFKALVPQGKTSYGRYCIVPRVVTP